MVQDAGLALNDGRGFGPEGGGYMRMNIKGSRGQEDGTVNLPDHELADVRGSTCS